MAYNPFDDIIEQDPAYMQEGGLSYNPEDVRRATTYLIETYGEDAPSMSVPELSQLGSRLRQQPVQEPPTNVPVPEFISQGRQIRDQQQKLEELQNIVPGAFNQYMQDIYQQRQEEDFSDVQQAMGKMGASVYETISAPETAERAKAKKEKNQQIKEQLGFGDQLSRSQMEQAKQYGYEPLTIGETFAAVPDFLYGDQAEAFRKLADGEQLESGDKYSLLFTPLDALDFVGVGLATGKVFQLLNRLRNKYKVPNLNEILDNPAYAGEPDVEEARALTIGAIPQPGLPIEQGGRQSVMFDKPDVPGGRGSSVITPSGIKLPEGFEPPPANKNDSYRYSVWRDNTVDKILSDIQATNPGIELSQREARAAIAKFFNKYYPETIFGTDNTKTFKLNEQGIGGKDHRKSENFFAKLNPIVNQYIKQSPGGQSIDYFTNPKTAPDYVFTASSKDPNYKGTPQYQYLNNKAEEFYKLNGERPDPGTLSNHIRQTDPEAVKNFTGGDINPKRIEVIINNQKKTGMPNTMNYVKPKKAKSIETLIDDLSKKGRDPEDLKIFNKNDPNRAVSPLEFERDYEDFLNYLRSTDAMLQTIKNGFDRFLGPYVNEFGEEVFKYTSMTKYLKKNAKKLNIPSRLFSFDNVNYQAPLESSAKIQREVNELDSMLEGADIDYRKAEAGVEYDLQLPPDIRNFFSHMYRTALVDAEKDTSKRSILSNKEFIEKYILPHEGNTTKETIENLRKEYPEIDKWLQLEKRFTNYEKALSEFMKDLKRSNIYDDESLGQIYASLKPNRAHDFPIISSLKKDRFVNMGAEADLIQVQPAVFNMVYQPIYDNVFRKLLNQFEGKTTLDALKKMPAKSIGDFKNSIGFNISVSDFKKTNPNGSQYDYLNWIYQKLDKALSEKGMVSVMPFKPKQANILKGLKIDDKFVGPSTFDTPEGDTLIIGSKERFTESKKGKMSETFSPGFYLNMAYNSILDSFAKGKRLPPETAPYKTYGSKQTQKKFILFNKGGPVRMALGGDPLQNINQQEFAGDPGFDGEDYFSQAVESGNLYAFNPSKIFKNLMKTDSVFTPNKIKQSLPDVPQGPPGQTLPATQTLQPEDFAFQSFTLNKIMDKNAPKAARPQDWANYLTGGQPAPLSEIQDTGLEQYLRDFESYFPNQKITQQQLVDFYETSPIGNIEIKVKEARNNLNRFEPGYTSDPAYVGYTGKAQHQNSGSQPLDQSGKDYREIVVTSGPLPGDKNPYVQSGHYQEENVLGFTRVANYEQPGGAKVAVIQEMQTDMLTKVRKEQERVQALLKRIQAMKDNAAIELGSGEPWRVERGQMILNNLKNNVPEEAQKALEKFSNLIKPYPNTAAKDLIPGYATDLSNLQKEIDAVVAKDIEQKLPETTTKLREISAAQEDVLNKLLDLNRSGELDQVLKGIEVPATRNTDELAEYANAPRPTSTQPGGYTGMKKLELFPPIPFNKQADYVDLLIKSTIKDAQSKGINKVAIYPSELVNKRWGKAPDSDAGKKFRDLYDNVGQQTMKNIAKKYGGEAKFEVIIDPTKSDLGINYFKKGLDGEYALTKQDQLAADLSFGEQKIFVDQQLAKAAHDFGANNVVYSTEVAPGQTFDYWVQPTGPSQGIPKADRTFELVPVGPGDDVNSALLKLESYNPQEVPMFTITLDSEKAQAPMYLFKKKSGGIIDKDSLVSITDIYGEYGR